MYTLGSAPSPAGGRQLSRSSLARKTMGVLSDFFLSADEEPPAYDCGPRFPAEDRREFKQITPLEAAGLLAVLRGGGDAVALMDEFPCLTDEDAEEWTTGVPVDFVSALADLDDDRLDQVAQECAESLKWPPGSFDEVVTELRDLARRAQQTQKQMYLWNSL